MLKCACVFCCWRCWAQNSYNFFAFGLRCIKSSVTQKQVSWGGANVGRTHDCVPCRAKIQVEPSLWEALKECRYGSAFKARVWPSFFRGLGKLHKLPDIFMWVTSRTPEELLLGGTMQLFPALKGESGPSKDDHRQDWKWGLTTCTCVVLAETSQIHRLLFASSAWSQVTAVLFSLMKTSGGQRDEGERRLPKPSIVLSSF